MPARDIETGPNTGDRGRSPLHDFELIIVFLIVGASLVLALFPGEHKVRPYRIHSLISIYFALVSASKIPSTLRSLTSRKNSRSSMASSWCASEEYKT